MKTRQMVDKSFSQHMIYQVFRAITHDIFNDKTWFPTSRCSCEDVFYEVFCIVDKMMFSHTDTESRLAFEPASTPENGEYLMAAAMPSLCGRNRAI